MRKKEKRLKTLIKSVGVDQPSAAFSETVMREIQMSNEKEAQLKALLSQIPPDKVSADFTQHTMARIQPVSGKRIYEPIISTKAWYISAAALFISVFSIVLLSKPKATPSQDTYKSMNIINSILDQLKSGYSIYLLGLVIISVLLIIDYLYQQKKTIQHI